MRVCSDPSTQTDVESQIFSDPGIQKTGSTLLIGWPPLLSLPHVARLLAEQTMQTRENNNSPQDWHADWRGLCQKLVPLAIHGLNSQ